jgi:short-subunit dehydrogenase
MNKVALITGTTSGIGYALCEKFAQEKIDIVLVSRNYEKLMGQQDRLQQRYGIRTWVIQQDLGSPEAARTVHEKLIGLDIEIEYLVQNAGFDRSGEFINTEIEKEKDMIQLNIVFLTEFTKLILPGMAARKSGRIMFLGSVASYVPCALNAVYSASKAYVLFFSRAIRAELKGTGITVTVLCPGPTNTEFAEKAGLEGTPSFSKFVMSAEKVAEAGYKSMMKGKMKHTPGMFNKFFVFASKVFPASLIDGVALKMFRKRL